MTVREKTLFDLEEKFWSGDKKFYEQNADESCLVAFTEMAGVMSNAELAATVKDGNRWKTLDLEPKGLVQPSDDVAIISYEAHAVRGSGEPYSALVSSAYVKRGSKWKMAFHQQTPLQQDKA